MCGLYSNTKAVGMNPDPSKHEQNANPKPRRPLQKLTLKLIGYSAVSHKQLEKCYTNTVSYFK